MDSLNIKDGRMKYLATTVTIRIQNYLSGYFECRKNQLTFNYSFCIYTCIRNILMYQMDNKVTMHIALQKHCEIGNSPSVVKFHWKLLSGSLDHYDSRLLYCTLNIWCWLWIIKKQMQVDTVHHFKFWTFLKYCSFCIICT